MSDDYPRLDVRIKRDIKRRLKVLAASKDMTLKELVEYALSKFLEEG